MFPIHSRNAPVSSRVHPPSFRRRLCTGVRTRGKGSSVGLRLQGAHSRSLGPTGLRVTLIPRNPATAATSTGRGRSRKQIFKYPETGEWLGLTGLRLISFDVLFLSVKVVSRDSPSVSGVTFRRSEVHRADQDARAWQSAQRSPNCRPPPPRHSRRPPGRRPPPPAPPV